jgi:hypothetical protein
MFIARSIVYYYYFRAPFLRSQVFEYLLQGSADARALVVSRYDNAVMRLCRLQTGIGQGKL